MKAPLSWLKDFVDIDCSVSELEEKLFSCGFEVEEIIEIGKNINKIVTCKILSIEKHPNADKLSVTKVDAGKYGQLQIVTSAKNIFVGAVVPVAVDGATLVSGDRIFNGELRGVPSQGMFCSGEELGINDDWYPGASVNGILILQEDLPLGEEVKELLQINDFIFDINVTANRSDCQSILGIAREVAAVLNKPLKMPDLTYKTVDEISTKKTVNVSVEATDLCPRYISHLVTDIKIEESPLWLKRRLFLMGIRSINNIVDVTNYVLNEIGQPMHAFDLNDLGDKSLIIRRANDGEKIITLDEKEFILNSNNLVICDKEKPVCLAGVMGGLNSGIKDNTTNVLFESATFKRDNVRKTSRQLGQRSDSSARFEKGVDLYSVEIGMKRALSLIDKLNCGKIACDCFDICSSDLTNKVISTTISRVNGVLGIEVPSKIINKILTSLGFGVDINGDQLIVKVPLYREDMEDYPDIAEEVIREYGYAHINPTLLKTSCITNGGLTNEQIQESALKDLLVSYGFNEIITYSFVSEKEYELFGLNEIRENKAIKILNPISEELAVMRNSLIPSIVKAVSYNLNRKNLSGRLFELAKVYQPESLPLKKLPNESQRLSLALFGEDENYFTLKGVVEGILNSFCYGRNISYKATSTSYIHPTRGADLVIEGKIVGVFGQLHPLLADKLGIDKPVYIAEINMDTLKTLYNNKIVFKAISKFPPIERDIALLVDKNLPSQNIVDCIKEAGGQFLKKVSLFDVYEGSQVEQGKKSIAYNLIFVSDERTLLVEEIDNIIQNVLKALRDKLNAVLR